MPLAICLKNRPTGTASADNFESREMREEPLAEGDVLVKLHYLSVDPYLRGRMNHGKSYIAPFEIGQPVVSGAVGEVLDSLHPDFSPGDVVSGYLPWQGEVCVKSGTACHASLSKIDTAGIPMTLYLGVLGMPGATAWTGLKGLANPKGGETVFVSAASGAVGSTVGQIAKQLGCRVVGSAGSDEKVAYLLDELNFDGAFNYRVHDDLDQVVREQCPDGVDVYFENTGGPVSEAVFQQLNVHARMIVCGLISRYQSHDSVAGPPLMPVLVKQIRIQGFIFDAHSKLSQEWRERGAAWFREGNLKYRESIVEGLENAPSALMDVLAGRNFGKHLVRL